MSTARFWNPPRGIAVACGALAGPLQATPRAGGIKVGGLPGPPPGPPGLSTLAHTPDRSGFPSDIFGAGPLSLAPRLVRAGAPPAENEGHWANAATGAMKGNATAKIVAAILILITKNPASPSRSRSNLPSSVSISQGPSFSRGRVCRPGASINIFQYFNIDECPVLPAGYFALT